MEDIHIRCPKCKWEPDGKPYWACSCGHQWDTFATAGRCPQCGKIWKDTQCVAAEHGGCLAWSPHLDWYDGLDEIIDRLKAEIEEKWLQEAPARAK
jgi:hypothetical protein